MGATIKVYKKKDLNNSNLITTLTNLQSGQVYVVNAPNGGQFEADTWFWDPSKPTSSKFSIHTSCSRVIIGRTYGPFTVVGYVDGAGNPCNMHLCDGSIDLTVTGGMPPYTYKWSNGSTSEDPIRLCPGTYAVTVKDKNGYTKAASFSVGQVSSTIQVSEVITNDASCGSNTPGPCLCEGKMRSITVRYNGPSGATVEVFNKTDLSYKFATFTSVQTGQVLTVSAAGYGSSGRFESNTYFRVNGGTLTAIHTSCSQVILGLTFGHFTVLGYTDGSWNVCNPVVCTGSIDLTVTAGNAPFSFLWSNGATSEDILGVCDGSYSVTVTDAGGCTAAFTYTVLQAPSDITSTVSVTPNTKCAPDCPPDAGNQLCFESPTNPSIVHAVSSWTFDQTMQTVTIRTTLAKTFVDNTYGTNTVGWPGNHSFNNLVGSDDLRLALYDKNGTKKIEFTMDYMSASSLFPSGYGTLGVTGGDGSMHFGSASDVVHVKTSLSENFNTYGYILTVNSPATDANYTPNPSYPNWIFEVWYEVTVRLSVFGSSGFGYPMITGIHASPSKTGNNTEPVDSVHCVPPCVPNCDGTVNLTVLSGSGPFTFSWSNGATTEDLSGVCGGTYTVTITDGGGCSTTETAVVPNSGGICEISGVDTICPNSMQMYASGASGPYNWSVSGNAVIQGSSDEPSVTVVAGACGFFVIELTAGNDSCVATCRDTVYIVDSLPPVFTFIPADIEASCFDEPEFGMPQVTDNCDPQVMITTQTDTVSGACTNAYTITRTWIATDACGNSSSATQAITVTDDTPPVITGIGPDKSITCEEAVEFDQATAQDGCGGQVQLAYMDDTLAGQCPNSYTITRTWTATDACGNSATASQSVTVIDTLPPVVSCPPDLTLTCGASTDPSHTGMASCVDCTPGIQPTYHDTVIHISAPAATEICINAGDGPYLASGGSLFGNDQYFTGGTTYSNPIPIANTTDDLLYQTERFASGGGIFNYNIPVASGQYQVELHFAEIYFGTAQNPGGGVGSRKFDVTIEGNIVLDDYDIFADAGGAAIAVVKTFMVSVSDDTLNIVFDGVVNNAKVSGICVKPVTQEGCLTLIQRTWTCTDVCGNSASCVQHITITDTIPPVVICPPDVTISCTESTHPQNTGYAVCQDNCGAASAPAYSDEVIPGTCPQEYTIYRTWMCVDACGNRASCTQTIQVVDDGLPYFTFVPQDDTVYCTEGFTFGMPQASDACGDAFVVHLGDDTLTLWCPEVYVFSRKWVALDSCGNLSTDTVVQQITMLNPRQSPVSTPASCYGSCDGTVSVSGFCYSYLWSSGSTTPQDSGLCAGTYTVTLTDVLGCSVIDSVSVGQPDSIHLEITATNVTCGCVVQRVPCGIDFSGLQHGEIINNQYDSLGIHFRAIANDPGVDTLIIFNSNLTGTLDPDLEVGIGNLAIIPINITGGGDGIVDVPNDNFDGGTIIVTFDQPTTLQSFVIVDVDHLDGDPHAIAYDEFNNVLKDIAIPILGDGSVQTVIMQVSGVRRLEITTTNSIGVTDFVFECASETCCDGTASAVATGGTPPYTFQWSNGSSATSIDSLCPGEYCVTVSDANGCVQFACVTVGEDSCLTSCDGVFCDDGDPCTLDTCIGGNCVYVPSPVGMQLQAVQPTACGVCDGQATASGFGGVPPYTYQWSTGDTTATIGNNMTSFNGTRICLNTGGPQFIGTANDTFLADNYYTGGVAFSNGVSIAGTTYDALYQTERNTGVNTPGATLTYNIPVINGPYDVELHFAEIYFGTSLFPAGGVGNRKFDVTIEGTLVLDDYDIFADAGGAAIAVIKTFPVTVADGFITIVFTNVVNRGKVSAICVRPQQVQTGQGLCAGTYHVTVTDSRGCSTTDSITLAGANCDDGNPCTMDVCENSQCFHIPITCDDGDSCTIDICVNGTCIHQSDPACVDLCANVNCDDGDACTTDSCINGQCINTPMVCDDGDSCTIDICVNGTCIHQSDPACVDLCANVNCDDGDACTTDSCINGQCINTPMVCDDGDSCTIDICVNGTCIHQSDPACVDLCANVNCDDGDACTTDSCINGQCINTPMVCDDGDSCTIDICMDGECTFVAIAGCGGPCAPFTCDDGNPCTVDVINPQGVCTHVPVDTTETYLRVVNYQKSWKKLRLGYSDNLWTPKQNVLDHGNNMLCITLRDPLGTADWSRLQVRPQGASTDYVVLGDYLPQGIAGCSTDWITICIPISEFPGRNFASLSMIEIPYSNGAGPFELHILKVEFVGGTHPFLWFGPGHTSNYHDGQTNGGSSLYAELITGMPCNVAPKRSGDEEQYAPNQNIPVLTGVRAYPVPFENLLNVEFVSSATGKAELGMMDILGRKLLSQRVAVNKGLNSIVLSPDATLTPGIYFLELKQNEEKHLIKLMK
ncbi:MAG: hypothetical protein KatS3mg031_0673 [Chitinophagales bacterium]|nr:MAG: hypothetical protein KatS3mg031_0673 [Chitinophagales bacterium]